MTDDATDWVKVVCTEAHHADADSRHRELTIARARIGADGLAETASTRSGAAKGRGALRRGMTVRAKFGDEWVEMVVDADQIMSADTFREDWEGRRRWRFPCPRCNAEGWVFSEPRLRAAVQTALNSRSVVDVSLPRRR